MELVVNDSSTDPNDEITGWRWTLTTQNGEETSDIQNPRFNVNESQVVDLKLVVESENGCIDSTQQSITINVLNIDLVTNDTTICKGNSIELVANANTNFSYMWSPSDGLDDPTSANPTATPESSTTYTVQISDGLCSITETVTVNIAPPLDVDRPDWFVACLGDTLFAPINDPDSSYRFIWMNDEVIVDGLFNSNPRVSWDSPREVQLDYFVFDQFDCPLRDSITVRFEGIIDFALEDTTITCIGNTVELNPNGNEAYEYEWSPSIFLDDANADNPIADVNGTTEFTVIVTNPEKPTCKFEDTIVVFTP
ncbi:MAG: hypothetical protein AAGK97_18245, partial [Bacteroidota bacterium]